MQGNNVLGILFAYLHDARVRTLTQNRVMASIPYGGRYRLVDFPLSNMVNSGINKIGIITEENYLSLMDHLGSGKAWDLSRKNEGLSLLPPFGAKASHREGRIEAMDAIRRFIKTSREDYVLLGDCDLVANIDYRQIFEFHSKSKADITLLYRRGDSPETERNLVLTIDPEQVVREIYLKRGRDYDCNYGLGNYLMSKERLLKLIDDCMSRNLYDFERDVLQRFLPELRICAYEFKDVAYSITSFESFFNANMALMDPRVRKALFRQDSPVYTKMRDDMPTRYGLGAQVKNSVIADGCVIEGEVENCVLFRGVKISKGAKVRNCVLMQDTQIGEDVRLDYVVTDKNVSFTREKTMMGYHSYPVYIEKGSVI